MHFGSNNIKAEVEINGKFLEEVTEERDLSVIIQKQNDLSAVVTVLNSILLIECQV